jgi:hypothetical protein
MTVTFFAVLVGSWMVAVTGVALVGGSIAGWLWPREETQET